MLGTASLAGILAVGGVVEVGAVDEEFTGEASVLADEVKEAGFLSLAEVKGEVAELVSLIVTLESEIVAGVGVIVDDLVEVTTLLTDEVETGVAAAEGVNVGPLEVAVDVAEVVAEVVEEVVGAGITSLALGAEVLDLVMVKEV